MRDLVAHASLSRELALAEKYRRTRGGNRRAPTGQPPGAGGSQPGSQGMEEGAAAAEGGGPKDAAVISTIHAAKGLEWDVVMVPRFNTGFLPINYR